MRSPDNSGIIVLENSGNPDKTTIFSTHIRRRIEITIGLRVNCMGKRLFAFQLVRLFLEIT
jgi:hypothetical protein